MNQLLDKAEVCRFFGGSRPIHSATLYRNIRRALFVDQSLALSSDGFFARLNNSVIRGTNTVPRKFTRNSVMKELVRRCIVR